MSPAYHVFRPAGDLSWQDQAACHGRGDLMFMSQYTHNFGRDGKEKERSQCQLCHARALCGECPVVDACREYALRFEGATSVVRDGIWGGLTPNQRQTVYDLRRAARAVAS